LLSLVGIRRNSFTIMVALIALALAGVAVGVSAPTPAAAVTAGGPDWLPFRGTFARAVNCTYRNCENGTYHKYNAIDFSVPKGTAVYASGPGVVVSATKTCSDRVLSDGRAYLVPIVGGTYQWEPRSNCGLDGGLGNSVKIRHDNGQYSVYGHMSNVQVSGNQRVDSNTIVGYVGNSGHSYGFHLHYEKRGGTGAWNTQIDPGQIFACEGTTRVSYPAKWGLASWSQVVPFVETIRNDNTNCAANDPVGSLDLVSSPAPGQVRVSGWAFDPNAPTTHPRAYIRRWPGWHRGGRRT